MYRYFTDLDFGGLYRVVENVVDSSRLDQIDTNRFSCCRFVMPEIGLRDTTPCESKLRCNIRIESNHKVPQTN